ncbi:unnamed protein product [Bursaphelenchus xylophilus]|uniref:(pine wood nematode) hypothetical protein n=1 Tax=Bursaphelenchus xylophilus TaxID=6326 RepID=A0A1I7RXP5_BURXY|nr:unnamed protein product [Bursaphelenchus xylophilus]CAG9126634.1 unnamed protein product [Bursaphelenchus xylophilus]
MRDGIQGLRCLAVTVVVFFHIWPKTFKNGFLGVDIFFVISGYLMCMLMSRRELTLSSVSDFYYRRIKRIFPPYIFILICTVIAATVFMAPTELADVVRKAYYSSLFVSNFKGLPLRGYFGTSTTFDLFLHTWSLSVEIQFYLIVPLVFWLMQNARHLHQFGDYLLIGALGMVSCFLQFYYENVQNISHMSFYCRIWQFMCGFIAYKAYNHLKSTICKKPRVVQRFLFEAYYTLLFCLLSLQLVYECFSTAQLSRYFTTVTTTMLLSAPDETAVLKWRPFVFIGDISYSIYLIHWPFIKLVHYANYDQYKASDGLPFEETIYLAIIACYVLSYIVEDLFKYLLSFVKTWQHLILTLALCYISLYAASIVAYHNSSSSRQILHENQTLDDLVHSLYQHREEEWPLDELATMELNKQMYDYGTNDWGFCTDMKQYLQTEKKFDLGFAQWMCHEKGNGSKEIVIFGNSLARDLLFGVKTMFHNIAGNITVMAAGHCSPYMAKFAKETVFCGEMCIQRCFEFEDQILDILENWPRKIDIIIVQHSYGEFKGIKYTEQDELQRGMQKFYTALDNIANEAVIMPYGEVWAPNEFPIYMKRVGLGQRDISTSAETQRSTVSDINRRIDDISCTKCIRVDYSQIFCETSKQGRCKFVSPHGVLHYVDHMHTTMYGGLFYGELALRHYVKFTVSLKNVDYKSVN